MFQSQRTYITPHAKMLDLINENYSLLLFLQHFNVDFAVDNSTVEELCAVNSIDMWAFITIGNLYNGFYPHENEINRIGNINHILTFLNNSHSFYKEDKYPELKWYLHKLQQTYKTNDFLLIERFFNDYFNEVLEHLEYEDDIAFPYFSGLINSKEQFGSSFSAKEYFNHHTDIETKLSDLKNLFLKHIKIKNELNTKRKFLNTLFVLEFDLKIHSIIEEKILIPLVERVENKSNG